MLLIELLTLIELEFYKNNVLEALGQDELDKVITIFKSLNVTDGTIGVYAISWKS